jgi:hypothetical protein
MPYWPAVPDNFNHAAAELQELAATVGSLHSASMDTAKSRAKLAASATRLSALLTWMTTTYPVE